MHDLTGIEDHRAAARFAEVAGECAIILLYGEFPIDHAPGTFLQIRAFQYFTRREEGFDDVAGGFRIAWQPAVLEAPSCRNTACVGVAVPDVLGTAEPVDYAREMGCMVKFGLGWCSNVIEDQTHMPRPPRTVTERQCK